MRAMIAYDRYTELLGKRSHRSYRSHLVTDSKVSNFNLGCLRMPCCGYCGLVRRLTLVAADASLAGCHLHELHF